MSALEVEVATDPPYSVRVGAGCLAELPELAARWPRCLVVSDAHVFELHGARLDALAAPHLLLPRGEAAKGLGEVEALLEGLAAAGLDRESLLVTLGGGALSDAAGLAAALYMRGIDVVHAPTTLLAQVDASVGGKTAVNLAAGKNLAGSFHQPAAVFADTSTLATLDDAEFRSGLGEVAKSALLEPGTLMQLLEQRTAGVLARDPEVLAEVVTACVRTKAAVVAADPHERGARRALNLGHTCAHGIEHVAGYGTVPHGVAVAAGIGVALACSAELGLLLDADLPRRWLALCGQLGLPADLDALRAETGLALAPAELLGAMRLDKKARGGELRMVLPLAVGRIELDVAAEASLLERVLA